MSRHPTIASRISQPSGQREIRALPLAEETRRTLQLQTCQLLVAQESEFTDEDDATCWD